MQPRRRAALQRTKESLLCEQVFWILDIPQGAALGTMRKENFDIAYLTKLA